MKLGLWFGVAVLSVTAATPAWAGSWVLKTGENPITDNSTTYAEAKAAGGGDYSLAYVCFEQGRDLALILRSGSIKADFYESDAFWAPVRVDREWAYKAPFFIQGSAAVFSDVNKRPDGVVSMTIIVDQMRKGQVLNIELDTDGGDSRFLRVPLDGFTAAARKVEAACGVAQ